MVLAKTTIAKQTGNDIITSTMNVYPTPIDISNFPDLKRLANEARKTGRQYVLRENNHDLAFLTPVDTERKQQTNQQAIEETLALAGAWKDLPSDHMEEEL